ncbi:hypothetical protein D9M70_478480 [compost metagenome]
MSSVGSISHQNHMGVAIEMTPLAADQAVEIQPSGATKMTGIGHEFSAIEHFREEGLAEIDGGLLLHVAQAMLLVGLFGRLNDEGRGVVIEPIYMRLEPTVISFTEVEGESVEKLVRPEPYVTVGPHHEVWLEYFCIAIADLRVETVGSNDQVRIWVINITVRLGFENQLHSESFTAPL